MAIRKLPEYLIDRLKKGEVIERPASIVKELIENSLDAGATTIKIDIHDGGKTLISVEDDGSWIELSDMDLLFEEYTTSRVYGEQDLSSLSSYGFRWEALASIAKVSKTTIISKTEYSEIGTKITKIGMDPVIKHQPVGFLHGTLVTVQDLFYNIPDRLKFFKSSQTEFFYCYNYVVDMAIIYPEKAFIFKKNDKVIFNLVPRSSLSKRIEDIYKKDWSKHLRQFTYQNEDMSVSGIVGDPQLLFWSAENIKIYINKRLVQDNVIKKALIDAYAKQISSSEYPLAILMIDAKSNFVDVNIYPTKCEVKFVNPRKVYDAVYSAVQQALWEEKASTISQQFSRLEVSSGPTPESASIFEVQDTPVVQTNAKQSPIVSPRGQEQFRDKEIGEYKIIGQLRNSYIILESADTLYYIDQYLLAEKTLFEKIRKSLKQLDWPSSEILLQPIMIGAIDILDLDQRLDEINALGFDVSRIGENKVAIYSIPQAFSVYKIDMEKVFTDILYKDSITFDTILDTIFSTHACKISVKSGEKLWLAEMAGLVQDWLTNIPGLFNWTHDKKIFIKMKKKDIEKAFDR